MRKAKEEEVKKVELLETADKSGEYITLDFKKLSLPVAIVISTVVFSAAIGAAIFFGLKARPVQIANTPTPAVKQTEFTASDFGEISIKMVNNVPTRGNNEAKVVMVEFGDFICPYCQKFFVDTYGTIAERYVNTGKVRVNYRDYPLRIHEPSATEYALLGICVNSVAGSEKYNSFHDLVSANPQAYISLTEVDPEKMKALMQQIGADYNKVTQCTALQSTKDLLKVDQIAFDELNQLAISKGIEPSGIGTPAFIIGTVDKAGMLNGKLISGAYPVSAFISVIEEQLKK